MDLACFQEDDLHVLTDAQRREFQDAWYRATGDSLSAEEAEQYADALVKFGALLLSISNDSS